MIDTPHEAKAAPEGWQLVPKEPSIEMIQAAILTFVRENGGIEHAPSMTYHAMLAAATSPPPPDEVDTTKLNAGQLVQRIMRTMETSTQCQSTAELAEHIAAEILKLPKDYWRKSPHETRAVGVTEERIAHLALAVCERVVQQGDALAQSVGLERIVEAPGSIIEQARAILALHNPAATSEGGE